MALPNWITVFRIFLIPIFVGAWLYYKDSYYRGEPVEFYRWCAIGIFLTAAISDAIDGFIARAWNLRSKLGATLDPLADKALMMAGLLVLTFSPVSGILHFPIWYLVLVLGRDLILVVGIAIVHLLHEPIEIKPHWTGKIATALQLASIVVVLFQISWLATPIIFLASIFTAVSTMIYIARIKSIHHASPQQS